MEKKLRDAYARCYYQQGSFPMKALEDPTAAMMLTREEILGYRRGLSPYSKAQIMKHIKDFDVARVVATDAYVSGAAMVEVIHGADMLVSVASGYSTLSYRLAKSRISSYDVYDVETADILADKYRRMESSEDIKCIELTEDFLNKIRFTKKCFVDMTGYGDISLVEKLGQLLPYDSAVVMTYRGDPFEIEFTLSDWGFRVYEYSTGEDLERRFFEKGNLCTGLYVLRPDKDFAIILAVKKP